MGYIDLKNVFEAVERKQTVALWRFRALDDLEEKMDRVQETIMKPFIADLEKIASASHGRFNIFAPNERCFSRDSLKKLLVDDIGRNELTAEPVQSMTIFFGHSDTVMKGRDDIHTYYSTHLELQEREKISFEFNHHGQVKISPFDNSKMFSRDGMIGVHWNPSYEGDATRDKLTEHLGEWLGRVMTPEDRKEMNNNLRAQETGPLQNRL